MYPSRSRTDMVFAKHSKIENLPNIAFRVNEIFKQVIHPDYGNRFFVSNYGRVYDAKRDCIVAQRNCSSYYAVHAICKDADGKKKDRTLQAHRLMLMAFEPIDNPQEMQGNHIDGCTINNKLFPKDDVRNNLEWCTPSENSKHSFRIGHSSVAARTRYSFTDEQLHEMCRRMSEGQRNREICDAMGFPYKHGCKMDFVLANLRRKHSYKHVSTLYDYPNLME